MIDISYFSSVNIQIYKSKFLARENNHLFAFIVQSRK